MSWFAPWSRRYADGLSSQAMEPPAESPPKASIPREEVVCQMSPARLLAKSLTDSETRDEWTSEYRPFAMGGANVYTNELRELTVTRGCTYSGDYIGTPFDLSKAEKKIVSAALDEFGRHLRAEAEKAALARLIAPRKGLQRDSGETPKSGSTRRAKARPRRGASND